MIEQIKQEIKSRFHKPKQIHVHYEPSEYEVTIYNPKPDVWTALVRLKGLK